MTLDPTRKNVALALLKRKRSDVAQFYQPTPMQERFHRSNAQYRLIGGANRSGKSCAVGMEIKYALEGSHPHRPSFPGGNYLLVTTSRQQGDKVWRQKLIANSELRGVDINHRRGMVCEHKIENIGYAKDQGIIALKSIIMKEEYGGARLFVIWSGDVNSWKAIEGIQLDGVFVDENCISEELLAELAVRVRDSYDDPQKPGGGFIVWGATETKVNQAYTRFKELCQDPDDDTGEYFEITIDEMVAVTAESGERAAKLMDRSVAQSRIAGDGGALDTIRIFPQFIRDIHTKKECYEPQPFDNIIMGYDPGMAHETGIVLAAIRKEDPNLYHVFRCFNRTRQTIDQEVDWVEQQLQGRTLSRVVYDPSAKASQKAAAGNTIANALRTELTKRKLLHPSCMYRWAQNRHEIGIRKTRDMLDKQHLILYTEEDGVEVLARQFILYRGRPGTNFTGVHGIIKKDDNLIDPMRYLCSESVKWADYGRNTGEVNGIEEAEADKYRGKRIDFHAKRIKRRSRKKGVLSR